MTKLLDTGKTDLLQFVSARTRRPFSAYLVKQPDGKVGFEFEAKEPGRRGARPVRSAPLRVLGVHPRDRQPIELHAGRYGPYVKHGATNATLPDRDAIDSLSLEQAVALIDEKAGRAPTRAVRKGTKARAPRTSREAAVSPEASKDMPTTPPRRVVGPRGGRTAEAVAHAGAVSRTPTRAASAQKRTPAAKSAATKRSSTPSAKTKPAPARTSVARKRVAAKLPPEGKGAVGTGSARKRVGTSTAARKAPVARKPATARKAKRR
jgi:hypothetical protein